MISLSFPSRRLSAPISGSLAAGPTLRGISKYAHYSTDRLGKQKTLAREEVVLEDFQVDRQYSSDLFRFDPPKGYRVLDSTQGIMYS